MYYNSLAKGIWLEASKKAALDVTQVLEYLGGHTTSHLAGVRWTVKAATSGQQTDTKDCGVFTCANATS